MLPNGSATSGAKRYTYNGLGLRMNSSALGITTQYASDGQLPLTISSGGDTTTILYGLGPVAEKMDEWNYVLTDGFNLPRQLTNMDGEITMSVRYNPWGKPIDPETGRFLTRGVNPNGTNPYVPFDPTSLLTAPLGLMAVYYGSRKSKKSAPYVMMLVLLVILPVSIGLACGGTATPEPAATTPEVSPTPTTTPVPVTEPAVLPPPSSTPTQTPSGPTDCVGCPPTPS